MKSIAFNVMVPEELRKKLEQYAKDKNISIASVIRIACSEFLKNNQ